MVVAYFKQIAFWGLLLLSFTLFKWNLIWILKPFHFYIDQDSAVLIYKSLVACQWFSVAFIIREIIRILFNRKFFVGKDSPLKPKLIRDLISVVLFFVTAAIVLNRVFEQPLTGIWITSGALAITIGFALRNIILDFFSGLAVNIENPYRIGDWIEIHQRFSHESIIGKVTEINWRSTHIRTEQNTNIVIPNSLITTMSVTTNFWHETKPTRYGVNFTLDFSVPHQRAKRILMSGAMEAYKSEGFVREQLPQVIIIKTDELGVVYEVRYWITPWHYLSPSIARDVIQSCILNHLNSSGLTLAYPKEDIYHGPLPTRQLNSDNALDRIRLLGNNELFSMLTENELEDLSFKMKRQFFKANQNVVKKGDKGNSMFILFEGLLDVIINDGDSELTVATLTPLNYFGEMSLLTGESRMATIRCVTESIVYEIHQADFNDLINRREEIIEQIAINISTRKAKNNSILEEKVKSAQTAEEFKVSLIQRIQNYFGVRI